MLITRAEPGAAETAARVEALGLTAIVEPLFALKDLPVQLPEFDALAFTSANGVKRFVALSPRRDVPVFVVGARTAEAARAVGFGDVASADGDVEALIRLLTNQLGPQTRLLHTGNKDRRGGLVETLATQGFAAEFRATYAATPVERPGFALSAHLKGRSTFDAALVHSPKGGAILADFLAKAEAAAPVRIAAISTASAAALEGLADDIQVASSPDETALLTALQRSLQRT